MKNQIKPKVTQTAATVLLATAIWAVHPIVGFAANERETLVSAVQQSKSIRGVVLDENGEPLIGVSVLNAANGTGCVTNLDGKFQLDGLTSDAVLTISYVGYKEMKISIEGKNELVIRLQPDNQLLEEVLVVGYGVQKKSNVTGAISSIKADDLKNNSMTNAASALQGKVSGVQVVNNSGAPGAAPVIRVRGYSSNGNSDPLYIVDGLKVDDISYLDPNSIKSMEILKDAASAAIYGAEAGNGVILITTKSGEKGKASITFDAQWTFSNLANKVDLMNANQYTSFYREGVGEAFNSLYNQHHIAETNTDWQDEMYETGKMQKYNVGIQGGNDQGTFFVSLGYMNNDGIVKLNRDYYRRLNGQINASYHIKPWLEIGTSNTIMASTGSSISESNNLYGVMKNVLLADPLTPLYYTDDNMPGNIRNAIANGRHPVQDASGAYYGMSWANDGMSPIAEVDIARNKSKLSSVNGSTYANIKPLKGLVFTTRLGYTIGSVSQKSNLPTRLTKYIDTNADEKLQMIDRAYITRYYQWENFANYTLETEQLGNFSLMAGMSYSNYEQESTSAQTNELSSEKDNFLHMDYSTNTADDYVGGNTLYKRKIAYYGRFTWDYMNRYNVQANFRADSYDAAYLDLNHNWGYFPSVSVGWIFSNEEFMKNITSKAFSYGKLRASYGVNGSISNLGNYMYATILRSGQYDTVMNTANMAYWLNGKLVQGIYPDSKLANPHLRWERSKQYDFGLDLRFFDNRLSFTADYYYKLTDGLLVQSTAQYSTGTQTVYLNVGEVVNKGFELELDWKDQIGDVKYGIKTNLSTLNNKVKKYKGEGTRIAGADIRTASTMTYFEEGYPLWYIRGYKLEGVNQETGEAVYADITGEGEITDADRTDLGCGIPDLTYGLTLSGAWKGLDFSIYGAGACGNKLVYGMMSASSAARYNRPMFLYENRWTENNRMASTPSAQYQLNDPRFYNSDAFVFDASYFKIKQIQLGYSLPKKILSPLGVEALRAYVSLENFFTFTKYPGSDPEVNASGNTASALAIDYGGYPMAKSVSFGFNLSF